MKGEQPSLAGTCCPEGTQTTSSGCSQFQRQMCPSRAVAAARPQGLPWGLPLTAPCGHITTQTTLGGSTVVGTKMRELVAGLSSAAVALLPRPRTPVEPVRALSLRLRHSPSGRERLPTCRPLCAAHSTFF